MSERQREANRINGAKGGPSTLAGKEISKLNSTRHGLTAKKLVLNAEDENLFQGMLDGYMELLNPANLEEVDLVREIVAGKWRQERYWDIETAMMDLTQDDAETEIASKYIDLAPIARVAYALVKQYGNLGAFDAITRYEGRMRRLHERARRDLDRLQKDRLQKDRAPKIVQPAPEPEPEIEGPISLESLISKERPARLTEMKNEPKINLDPPLKYPKPDAA